MLQSKSLSLSKQRKSILKSISFSMNANENLAVLGHSGSGKSTLLRAISGLDVPDSGLLMYDNEVMFEHNNVFVPPEKRNIGFVFQDLALFPHLSVEKNIGFGLSSKLTSAEKNLRIQQLLVETELEDFRRQFPHEISGGQKQRVALARTLAPKPRLVLMDEPFSSLDEQLRTKLCRYTKSFLANQSTPGVLVTHKVDEAFYFGDKILILNQGEVSQFGTAEDILSNPKTSFVATFAAGYVPLPHADHQKSTRFIHPRFLAVAQRDTKTETDWLNLEASIVESWSSPEGTQVQLQLKTSLVNPIQPSPPLAQFNIILENYDALREMQLSISSFRGKTIHFRYPQEKIREFYP